MGFVQTVVRKYKRLREFEIKWFLVECLYKLAWRYRAVVQHILAQHIDFLKESLKYPLHDALQAVQRPNIRTCDETIDALLEKRLSLVRFGDGELFSIIGKANVFQVPSPQLSQRLKDILRSKDERLLIGILRYYYYGALNENNSHVCDRLISAYRLRPVLDSLIHREVLYCDACLSIPFLSQVVSEDYYEKWRRLWAQREIVIICGQNAFSGQVYNIFDNAAAVTYQYAPSLEAFAAYDTILQRALTIDKSQLVVVVLGTTATVLAYDLAMQGYQALDLGHLAKAYDFFKRGKALDVNFFARDF